MDLGLLSDADTYVSLLTLTALEVVLGIDNVVFISILTAKLPLSEQPLARRLGLSLALLLRVGLLFTLSWVMGLTTPWLTLLGRGFSGRDMILLGGGLFLIGKATHEIHQKVESDHEAPVAAGGTSKFGLILLQIVALDLVFSLDSVITAVGMAQELAVMVTAVIVAVGLMLVFAGAIGDFVNRHPGMKVLALSFLLLIGVMLVADGMGVHVGKGYIYFAMAFSFVVELLNIRRRRAARVTRGASGRASSDA
jgi:predicted tellurium resistance membrane protein TerC